MATKQEAMRRAIKKVAPDSGPSYGKMKDDMGGPKDVPAGFKNYGQSVAAGVRQNVDKLKPLGKGGPTDAQKKNIMANYNGRTPWDIANGKSAFDALKRGNPGLALGRGFQNIAKGAGKTVSRLGNFFRKLAKK